MKQADLVQIMTDLANKNGGTLSAPLVLDAARSKKSPLHEYFDWDDSVAGEKWRLEQAGQLIRRVKVNVIREDREAQKVTAVVTRAFVHMDKHKYEPVETVLSDAEKRKLLIQTALDELTAFQRKYADLDLLAGVFEAIEAFRSKAVAPIKAPKKPVRKKSA